MKPTLTLHADGTFSLVGSQEDLKSFFDVLEVTEGDVPEDIEQSFTDETEIERDNAMESYYKVRNVLGNAFYPDSYEDVK